jgi:hypothetical protein
LSRHETLLHRPGDQHGDARDDAGKARHRGGAGCADSVLLALLPLVLNTSLTLAGLVTLRDDLQSLMDDVQDRLNTVEIARDAGRSEGGTPRAV